MKTIKLSDVIEMFENGSTRKEIAQHFGITMSEAKKIFGHPLLKGKRQRRKTFAFVDDVTSEPEISGEDIAEEGTVEDIVEPPAVEPPANESSAVTGFEIEEDEEEDEDPFADEEDDEEEVDDVILPSDSNEHNWIN